uniref:Uncharacterized protein n=1 Tax=Bacillus cereus HuA4-10 TaxID=1053206 RepID=J8CPS1_BACCE|nr:hypothetical protein IGC_04748 [Bacillus cereus HuA4-10]
MDNGTMQSGWWGLLDMHVFLIQQGDNKISRTLCEYKNQNAEIGGFLHGGTTNFITGYR